MMIITLHEDLFLYLISNSIVYLWNTIIQWNTKVRKENKGKKKQRVNEPCLIYSIMIYCMFLNPPGCSSRLERYCIPLLLVPLLSLSFVYLFPIIIIARDEINNTCKGTLILWKRTNNCGKIYRKKMKYIYIFIWYSRGLLRSQVFWWIGVSRNLCIDN